MLFTNKKILLRISKENNHRLYINNSKIITELFYMDINYQFVNLKKKKN